MSDLKTLDESSSENSEGRDLRGVLEGPAAKTLLGHPVGLFYLFFVEMWERFSYYGMRALLVLYLTEEILTNLASNEAKVLSFGIYGAYGSLVYLTPLFGGMIADRFIGQKKSIMLGCMLMTAGHAFMAFEGEIMFYLALGLLIVGNGFFKPNIATLVGGLYKPGDTRRDGGYTIFYMGVNTGSFLAAILCGWLGKTYGYHYGFGAAGIGMFLGLLLFLYGVKQKIFGYQGDQPETYQKKKVLGQNIFYIIAILGILAVPVFGSIVRFNAYEVLGYLGVPGGLMDILVGSIIVVIGAYIAYVISSVEKVERNRMLVILIYMFSAILFWSFFEQSGSSLTLFSDENVNMWLINSAQSTSLNAGYIMLLAIPLSMLWSKLAKKGKNPSSTVKMGWGIIQLGIGFFIFSMSARFMDGDGRVPFFFLAIGWLIVTTGELFFSPIGQSKVNALSPKKFLSFFMGVWFLSSFFAHYISGSIAKLTTESSGGKGLLDPLVGMISGFTNGVSDSSIDGVQNLANYTAVFAKLGIISVIFGIAILILSKGIRKMTHGID